MILGVDLGLHGGLVWLDRGPVLRHAERRDGLSLGDVHALVVERPPSIIVVEQPVPVRHGGGVDSGYTALMHQLGQWQGLAAALSVVVVTVPPRTWQAMLSGLPGDTKARASAWCRMFLPELDLRPGLCRTDHTGIVDAACIAAWGLRERRVDQ